MLTAVLGLSTAVFFGGADFLGGFAAQRIRPIRAGALSSLAGLIVIAAISPLFGGTWSLAVLGWGALAGLIACVAVSLIYASLAIGPMSLLAPLMSVVSAVTPMTVGLLRGERLSGLGTLGLAAGLVAIGLVGFVPQRLAGTRPSGRGILFAVGAGLAIGAGLVVLDQAPHDSGMLPLLVGRVVTCLVLFGTIVAMTYRGARGGGWIPGLRFALLGGVLAAIADGLMLTGLRVGDLSVMAVLVALNSAATAVLAAIVLRERITPVQSIGLGFALLAAALLALG